MRGNRQYMNEVNLLEDEKAVLKVFLEQAGGKAMLSRKLLEVQLLPPHGKMSQRTLDRILRRLEKWGYLKRKPTKDRGAVYYLSTALPSPLLDDLAYQTPSRGEVTVAMSVPVTKLNPEEMIEELQQSIAKGFHHITSSTERKRQIQLAEDEIARLKRQIEESKKDRSRFDYNEM